MTKPTGKPRGRPKKAVAEARRLIRVIHVPPRGPGTELKLIPRGTRFGRLVVVERVGSAWKCRCDCGGTKIARGPALRRGDIISCGCAQRRTHGLSKTHPLYRTWVHMHERCRNPNFHQWADYGGRGITVCARWSGREGFVNFIADMGERPEGLTLDRIDNDGNYEPGNCRWATRAQQTANRRARASQPPTAVARYGEFEADAKSWDFVERAWISGLDGFRGVR